QTSVGISTAAAPAEATLPKKAKVEAVHADMLSNVSTMRSVSNTTPQAFDKDGYFIEVIKKRDEYKIRDLLVPSDARWSRSFLGTIILWAGTQQNLWCIPEEELLPTLQLIWDLVYPNMKYRVIAQGSVMAIVIQRLSEWRNGFGSAALSLMISFFVNLGDDEGAPQVAKDLLEDYAFLDEDPDKPSANGRFCSSFLLELLSTTYISNINGYIEVPGWRTNELAGGRNMASVIALAAAALERAVQFIKDGVINIKDIHAAVEVTGRLDSRLIKLPKVINPQTGKETRVPYMFSSDNWGGNTLSYREAIARRLQSWIQETFSFAYTLRSMKFPTNSNTPDVDGDPADVNPRCLLCITF
ncbi:hypothetical protein EV363DRAFT_1093884, partial [Boletus edulis]